MAPIHNGIKRRHFLKALGSALVGVAAATVVPANPDPAGGISFDPRPAAESLADVIDRSALKYAYDRVSIRFTRQFIVSKATHINRLDVLYGVAAVKPNAMAWVIGA